MDDIEPISPPNSELDRLRSEISALSIRVVEAWEARDQYLHSNVKLKDEILALRAQLAEARAALAAATLTAPTSGGMEE